MSIKINLDQVLEERDMQSVDLANAIGITKANLSILKTGKAKAIRFSTLERICEVLDCQPGDLISYEAED
ncbi:helix-turn-helix domain-containing protein [Psychroflexus salinarum]|uniref:Helix-turn-helix domain-containing protein n=1 Tax=Psychroflexus salinarum TaxID=546024 RepID=A0ABW3GN19_9FLAO